MAIEEEVEQRQVGRFGGEHRPHREAEHVAGAAGPDVASQPRLDGLAVPPIRPRRVPRVVERHGLGHAVETQLGLADVGEDRHRELRDRAPVAAMPAPVHDDVVALVVGREQLLPEVLAQRDHAVLGRAEVVAMFTTRPPTRSRASTTTTERPAASRSRAATSPARPAPTTTMSTSTAHRR